MRHNNHEQKQKQNPKHPGYHATLTFLVLILQRQSTCRCIWTCGFVLPTPSLQRHFDQDYRQKKHGSHPKSLNTTQLNHLMKGRPYSGFCFFTSYTRMLGSGYSRGLRLLVREVSVSLIRIVYGIA